MLTHYEFVMLTRTYFGNKCVKDALDKEKELIGDRTLIITTSSAIKKIGFLDELISFLECEVFVYDHIRANPDVSEIREAIVLGKQNTVSSVIGFGGGSAMDAAKAVAMGIVSDLDIEEYLVKGLKLPENTLPIIAIPTTSGTGSELSKGAIISSREKRIKAGIRGEKLTPTVAIIDPTYTFSLPMNVTMESGFDVFAHAAESYCAVKANPFSEMLSEKAIKIVGECLPRLVLDLRNQESREQMSFASHIMGYNLKNVGNCLPHRLQYPIGAENGKSHGAGLIALYPAWIKYEANVNYERVDTILNWLGCDTGEPEDRIRGWLEKVGISRTITDLGNKLSAKKLAEMVTGNLENDRLANTEGIIETLYKESM